MAPTGSRLTDGHASFYEFANNATVGFWELTVVPPGFEGGDANQTSTMRNTVWRTKAPRKLKELTDSSFTAAYDTAIYGSLPAMINDQQIVTLTFPILPANSTGATLAFWAWLRQFIPNELQEGQQPDAQAIVTPGNTDNNGAEVAPTYTPGTV